MFAQGGYVVKGVVVDELGPVIGATILEVGTTNGTATDMDGAFVLTVSSANAIVEVSCIGYGAKTFTASETPETITLSEDAMFLEEAVAIGYGSQKKKEVTGSVASVKAEFDHSYGTAGFRVIDYGFESVTAEVTVDMEFYGWPGNDRSNLVYADPVTWRDEVELYEEADWSGLVDVEPALNQLYSMAPINDKNGNKLWYGPHGVTMEFVFKLSSPYIIIDGILDDADWGEPDYINFKIEADFVQEGVYQLPEKEGNSAGSGWIENDIFINLG